MGLPQIVNNVDKMRSARGLDGGPPARYHGIHLASSDTELPKTGTLTLEEYISTKPRRCELELWRRWWRQSSSS